MSLDIVEIALDYMTDYMLFEKLASEIMRSEGYPNIKPLGGMSDSGQDAVQESYFLFEGRSRVVFQYTTQKYLPGKIDDTIEKLDKSGCQYNELVIVTSRSISFSRQSELKQYARKNHDVNLNIFERKTLVNRLSDFDNGIFIRYYPDIENQVKFLGSIKPFTQVESGSFKEISLLKSSLAFTMNKNAPQARKSIFDYLTLSLLHTQSPLTFDELASAHQQVTGGQKPPLGQIQASVDRLMIKGLISKESDKISLSNKAIQELESETIRANEATDALVGDIIEEILKITGKKLSIDQNHIISENTRNVLAMVFQLYGIEISSQLLKSETKSILKLDDQDLCALAKNNLPPETGDLLISIISDVLNNPTDEQAETIKNWSLAYLGVEIMNFDPTLRELQVTRFSSRLFLLDTDFILDCIVKECPASEINLSLIRSLRNLSCRVIIPKSCIEECITHAKISFRTYKYFGQRLFSLSPSLVDTKVNNVFVKGYYYGVTRGLISNSVTFDQYLKNYLEPSDSTPFFVEVIRTTFPNGVEIIDSYKLLDSPIGESEISALSKEMETTLSTSKKVEYRSHEDIEQLAETDSRLFLTTLKLSQQSDQVSGRFLGGCCYLITASGRYRRAAKNIGITDDITTRPQTLMGLLELIGSIDLSPIQFVSLFENPLLIYAVSQSWNDVESMLDSGINLRNASIARLTWDLAHEMHNLIVKVNEAEQELETEGGNAPTEKAEEAYINLVRTASTRGYKNIPELEKLMQSLEIAEKKAKVKELEYSEKINKVEELEKAFSLFGKRKQNYLKRLADKIR